MACNNISGCLRGHRYPTLQSVYSVLGLSGESILNVYVVGSHLWQTCSKSSDWDLIVIIDPAKGAAKPSSNLHKGNMDILELSVDEYKERLKAHSMQVLLTLWLPECYILKTSFNPRAIFQLSKPQLIESLSSTKERDLRVAEKHFRKGSVSQAKKVIMHCTRLIDLGVQLQDASVTASLNYSAANCYKDDILNNNSKTWHELFTSLEPLLDSLWAKLLQ